ncbi:MAG: [protein-PII] uridylyltransferase [Ignavibacteriales bacterium]|nr:[protein-PII] uridylyltransferase [Ignavibacteriales bacterium]
MKRSPDAKTVFARDLADITKLHSSGKPGVRVSLALTQRLDLLIRSIFHGITSPRKRLLAVVGLGGYGRCEMCFSSDTDVMFLVADEEHKPEAVEKTKDLINRIFDNGLSVGHSFRSVRECLDFQASDIEVWTSLLESRFICGNVKAFASFRSAMERALKHSEKSDFVKTLLTLSDERHGKFGASTKLLEPNVKLSAGGLRDLHTILWILRGTHTLPVGQKDGESAVVRLLNSRTIKKLLPPGFLKAPQRSFDFLLRVRNEMHLQSKSLHDSLDFLFQPQVAEGLGYRPSRHRSRVEHFMQDYYVATRAVDLVYRRVGEWARSAFTAAKSSGKTVTLDSSFVLRDGKVGLRSSKIKLSNTEALQAFLHSAAQKALHSFDVEDSLYRSLKNFRPLKTPLDSKLFRQLLGSTNVGPTFRRINELGVLARWIPEWAPMVAYFQHNVYHYYTVDEHTLNVLANAEALESSSSSFGKVFRSLPDRVPLYLACILHDIAKPVRAGDHEIVGVTLSRKILQRLQYDDILADVEFLVRNHLLMEQIAFRRNLNDPQTIIDFSAKVRGVHQLDLLYVLTHADLSAVNKNVWTDWKEALLFELYRKTRDVLEHKMTPKDVEHAATQRRHAAIQELITTLAGSVSAQEAQKHLVGMDNPAYLSAFDASEIAQHIQDLRKGDSVSTLFRNQQNSTHVTILSTDAPFALSKFCGVLSANDANIIDAHIFTRDDGIIIDKFRVVDDIAKSQLTAQQCEKIQRELADVISGSVMMEELLDRHRMKWKRRSRHHNPNIRIDVEFEDHPRYTIIDVYAPDMLGFLYRVTEAISKLGLNISSAKIATRGDGIVDSFYVLDMTGSKLTQERQQLVKAEIMRVVGALAESELVPT